MVSTKSMITQIRSKESQVETISDNTNRKLLQIKESVVTNENSKADEW